MRFLRCSACAQPSIWPRACAGATCCGAPGGWVVYAGSLLFLASDALLTHTTFCTTAGEHRFSVMLTYLAAQGLMVAGFLGGF